MHHVLDSVGAGWGCVLTCLVCRSGATLLLLRVDAYTSAGCGLPDRGLTYPYAYGKCSALCMSFARLSCAAQTLQGTEPALVV